MKKYIKTLLIFSFMLMNSIAFAFPPDIPNEPDPPAPIDNYVFVLIVLGIGFAFWMNFRKASKA